MRHPSARHAAPLRVFLCLLLPAWALAQTTPPGQDAEGLLLMEQRMQALGEAYDRAAAEPLTPARIERWIGAARARAAAAAAPDLPAAAALDAAASAEYDVVGTRILSSVSAIEQIANLQEQRRSLETAALPLEQREPMLQLIERAEQGILEQTPDLPMVRPYLDEIRTLFNERRGPP
jgi:hypothetical protein